MTPSNSIAIHSATSGNSSTQGVSQALATFRANLALLNSRPLQIKSGTLVPAEPQSKASQIARDTAGSAASVF